MTFKNEAFEALQDRYMDLREKYEEVRQAALDIYLSGHWECPRVEDAGEKWTRLRDALGVAAGSTGHLKKDWLKEITNGKTGNE